MATAKTVTLDNNCHAFAIIHLLSSNHSLDALGILILLPGLFDTNVMNLLFSHH
ncbi:hypothetical protein PILCRDRAFT_7485 [Piloderma croceum F 1598]|uniref:Uncharacterized protein n=1 Tax=Piloderma croceum (strain F 1598) TaxID=765440 RepID=A0A0C3B9T7_PILCF|nr:hypothetical protein PILCRDRAFT_7485 [Piloderma croceum F 1598]